jgi:hypothetical protein
MHDGTLRKLRATNAPAKVRLSRGHRWLRRHRNVPAMPNLQVVVYSRLRGSESKEVIGYRRRPGPRFRSIGFHLGSRRASFRRQLSAPKRNREALTARKCEGT